MNRLNLKLATGLLVLSLGLLASATPAAAQCGPQVKRQQSSAARSQWESRREHGYQPDVVSRAVRAADRVAHRVVREVLDDDRCDRSRRPTVRNPHHGSQHHGNTGTGYGTNYGTGTGTGYVQPYTGYTNVQTQIPASQYYRSNTTYGTGYGTTYGSSYGTTYGTSYGYGVNLFAR